MFTSTLMQNSYPTGEDPNVAFARCLLLDNKPDVSRNKLGTDVTIGKMLEMWEERYERFVNVSAASRSAEAFNHPKEEELDLSTDPYTSAVLEAVEMHSYIISKFGYIGVGPNNAIAGGVVAIFSGAETPFVLRKVELDDSSQAPPSLTRNSNEERWRIVGSCYLHGFMDSEVASTEWDDNRQMIWIE